MDSQIMENGEPTAESFISVDVETSGPIPGAFSLLSIGACVVRLEADCATADDSSSTFYCTLRPVEGAGSDPAALAVSGLSLEELARTGSSPEER
jgi:hypothetical protein